MKYTIVDSFVDTSKKHRITVQCDDCNVYTFKTNNVLLPTEIDILITTQYQYQHSKQSELLLIIEQINKIVESLKLLSI
jgi:hypothetical protein